jgi:hypothetical protein
MEGENVMNTACERINYALDRVSRVGWMKKQLREGANAAGPACLLGSLIADSEYASLLEQAPTPSKWIGAEGSEAFLRDVFRDTAQLPGLLAAVQAMGFRNPAEAWGWNDYQAINETSVLDRLSDGKKRACA